ncbi:hypothetical protein BASA62_009530 [Batrachochytrium salamandrivorans]|nr:hypothetical protein BASA62_009530 [Batrachochytrium salamandrivorans]
MGKGRDKKKKKRDATAAISGGVVAGAKNKLKEGQKRLKQKTKNLKSDLGEAPEEDIDAILEQFRKEQEDEFKVTEEADCPPPSRRANATLTANPLLPSELLLFGGEYYDGQKVYMYNDFYKFDTEKHQWRRITSPNSPGPRSSHQVVITPAGRLFLWGGEFVSPNETNFFHYKDFWTMDLKTNAWERLELRATRYYDDLWVFDTLEFKWTRIDLPEPRPSARSGFQMFACEGLVCIYGGYCKTFVKGKRPVGVVHTDMWVLKMSLQVDTIRWERRKRPGGLGPT